MVNNTEQLDHEPEEGTSVQVEAEQKVVEIAYQEWDPTNLTLAQIASVKYQPLGGKG